MSSFSEPLAERLAPRIARDAHELLQVHLPGAGVRYRWADLLPGVIETALERALAQSELTRQDRGRLERAARRAARDWIPLHEVERACQILVSCLCRALWSSARPAECDAMLGLSRWAADRLPDVLGILRAAYVDQMRRLGGRRPDDDVIIGALLEGGEAVAIARAAGRVLPEPCALVALSCAQPPGRRGGFSFTAPPAAVLEALADDPAALCAPNWDASALVALVGIPAPAAAAPARWVRQTAERLLEGCARAYRGVFVAGMAIADARECAASAAREAVGTASFLARPDPPRRLAFREDVALEVLVAGESSLRRRLEARVAAVRARPDLWATLREIYRADLDRGRTARRLGIHRSTLDYRLDRIEQLTDVRPTSVHGILLFAAAQAAADAPADEALLAGAGDLSSARDDVPDAS